MAEPLPCPPFSWASFRAPSQALQGFHASCFLPCCIPDASRGGCCFPPWFVPIGPSSWEVPRGGSVLGRRHL
eukprot:14598299-Heterocapsa_arctica.AAC.1